MYVVTLLTPPGEETRVLARADDIDAALVDVEIDGEWTIGDYDPATHAGYRVVLWDGDDAVAHAAPAHTP